MELEAIVFVEVAFMVIILIWVFEAPKSYLKVSIWLGFLLMILVPVLVHIGLEKARMNLPDYLHQIIVVSGGWLGWVVIITSQLTLWASRNHIDDGPKDVFDGDGNRIESPSASRDTDPQYDQHGNYILPKNRK